MRTAPQSSSDSKWRWVTACHANDTLRNRVHVGSDGSVGPHGGVGSVGCPLALIALRLSPTDRVQGTGPQERVHTHVRAGSSRHARDRSRSPCMPRGIGRSVAEADRRCPRSRVSSRAAPSQRRACGLDARDAEQTTRRRGSGRPLSCRPSPGRAASCGATAPAPAHSTEADRGRGEGCAGPQPATGPGPENPCAVRTARRAAGPQLRYGSAGLRPSS